MSISSSWGLARSLIVYYGQPWKTVKMRRFYGSFVPAGGLAFDVGAHVGTRTRCWSGLGAKVVAVEPQPQMLSVLQRLFGKNPNVSILGVGLADVPGRLVLHINTRNPTLTTLSGEWVEAFESNPDIPAAPFDAEVEVQVRTLDELIAEWGVPDFRKIDVEGFEDKVLMGLTTAIPALSFEAFPLDVERSLRCIRRLQTLGDYRYRTVRAETFTWVEPEWVDAATMEGILRAWSLEHGSGDVYAQLHSM